MSEIAFITPFYNPAKSINRLQTYRRFRLLMKEIVGGSDLFSIELGDNGPSPWFENVVPVTSRSVLWHKERMINILGRQLADKYRYIAWIDCDLVPVDRNFKILVLEALKKHNAVQLFKEVHYKNSVGREMLVRWGVAAGIRGVAPVQKNYAPGGGWAVSSEVFSGPGVFDLEVVGGGDNLTLHGFTGSAPDKTFDKYHPSIKKEWWRWRDRIRPLIKGNIGFVDCPVNHLWHGHRKNRQYQSRYELIKDVDVKRDLETNGDGMLEWARNKEEMNEKMMGYFKARKEDDD